MVSLHVLSACRPFLSSEKLTHIKQSNATCPWCQDLMMQQQQQQISKKAKNL